MRFLEKYRGAGIPLYERWEDRWNERVFGPANTWRRKIIPFILAGIIGAITGTTANIFELSYSTGLMFNTICLILFLPFAFWIGFGPRLEGGFKKEK